MNPFPVGQNYLTFKLNVSRSKDLGSLPRGATCWIQKSILDQLSPVKSLLRTGYLAIVDGFDTSINNLCSSNWIISPGRGKNKKYWKPPPKRFFPAVFSNCFLQLTFSCTSLTTALWILVIPKMLTKCRFLMRIHKPFSSTWLGLVPIVAPSKQGTKKLPCLFLPVFCVRRV